MCLVIHQFSCLLNINIVHSNCCFFLHCSQQTIYNMTHFSVTTISHTFLHKYIKWKGILEATKDSQITTTATCAWSHNWYYTWNSGGHISERGYPPTLPFQVLMIQTRLVLSSTVRLWMKWALLQVSLALSSNRWRPEPPKLWKPGLEAEHRRPEHCAGIKHWGNLLQKSPAPCLLFIFPMPSWLQCPPLLSPLSPCLASLPYPSSHP